jgi:hypothetical protein
MGTCMPFVGLLAVAVRELRVEQVFVPLLDESKTKVIQQCGYHILKVIAVSDMDYAIYPKVKDGWKSNDTIYNTISKI